MIRKTIIELLTALSALFLLAGCIQLPETERKTETTESAGTVTAEAYLTAEYTYEAGVEESLFVTELDPRYLLLANKEHPLGSTYMPKDLCTLTCATNGGKEIELERRAAEALYAMLDEMRGSGITDVSVTSAYRSYQYQVDLFNYYLQVEQNTLTPDAYRFFGEAYIIEQYVNKGKTGLGVADARRVVESYSAPPGKSEHQSGLCVDLITSSMAGLTEAFEDTAAFRWLSQNAYRFGFILRYPKGKENITGYSYEPWHYRFVGREAATEIWVGNLTLEEFLGGSGTQQ